MTVPTVGNVATNQGNNATTLDVTFTVTADSDRVLLAWADTADSQDDTLTGIQLDPGGPDQQDFIREGGAFAVQATNHRVECWYLIAPPTGTYTVRFTATGATARFIVAVVQINGVDQTDPIGATAVGSGTDDTPTVDVTTTAVDSLVQASFISRSGQLGTPGTDDTERWDRVQSGYTGWGGDTPASTTGTYTVSANTDATAGDWVIFGVEVLAVATSPGVTINANVGTVNISGQQATVTPGEATVSANVGTVGVAAQQATISPGVVTISANAGTVGVEGQYASIFSRSDKVPTPVKVTTDSAQPNSTTFDMTVQIEPGVDNGALVCILAYRTSSSDAGAIDSVVLDPGGPDEVAFSSGASSAFAIGSGGLAFVVIMYVLDPPVGTYTVRATDDRTFVEAVGGLVQLSGVNQSDPAGANDFVGQGSGSPASADITTENDNSLIVGGIYYDTEADLRPGANVQEYFDIFHSTLLGWGGDMEAATAGNHSLQAELSDLSGIWSLALLEVNAVPDVSIQANVGLISVGGQTATVETEVTVQANVGALAVTGQTADVVPGGITVAAATGLIPIEGQQAAVVAGETTISAAAGAISVTGQQATVVAGAVTVSAAAGLIDISGQTAAVVSGAVSISAAPGAISVSGQQADVQPGAVTIQSGTGLIGILGQTADVSVAGEQTVNAAVGSIGILGQQATIVPGETTVSAAPGTVSISGQAATIVPGAVTVVASPGTVSVLGQAADVQPGEVVTSAGAGLIQVSGQQATITAVSGLVVNAAVATIEVAGQQATVATGPVTVDAEPATISIAGRTAVVTPGEVTVAAAVHEIGIVGQQAAIIPGATSVVSSVGTVVIAGQTATVTAAGAPQIISSAVGVISVSGQQADVVALTEIAANVGLIEIDGAQATIVAGAVTVEGDTGIIVISGPTAFVVGAGGLATVIGSHIIGSPFIRGYKL